MRLFAALFVLLVSPAFAATFDERIGPWQLTEGTLWFGKTFYDGEGHTGVGGFGYFDAARKAYRLVREICG